MSHARFVPESRRFVSASCVLVLHVGLLYVLNNGLSHSWTPLDIGPLEAEFIDEPQIEPAEPPPPPPRMQALPVDTLPMPDIAIDLQLVLRHDDDLLAEDGEIGADHRLADGRGRAEGGSTRRAAGGCRGWRLLRGGWWQRWLRQFRI